MPGLETVPQTTKFDELVRALSESLGPTSGIDSEDVDPQELQDLMAAYESNEEEWRKYYWPDAKNCYTRNLVDKGNGKSNLLVLVWSPGMASKIHECVSDPSIFAMLPVPSPCSMAPYIHRSLTLIVTQMLIAL